MSDFQRIDTYRGFAEIARGARLRIHSRPMVAARTSERFRGWKRHMIRLVIFVAFVILVANITSGCILSSRDTREIGEGAAIGATLGAPLGPIGSAIGAVVVAAATALKIRNVEKKRDKKKWREEALSRGAAPEQIPE